MRYLILLALAFTGCARVCEWKYQPTNQDVQDLIDCEYKHASDDRLTLQQKMDLQRGCYDLYRMKKRVKAPSPQEQARISGEARDVERVPSGDGCNTCTCQGNVCGCTSLYCGPAVVETRNVERMPDESSCVREDGVLHCYMGKMP